MVLLAIRSPLLLKQLARRINGDQELVDGVTADIEKFAFSEGELTDSVTAFSPENLALYEIFHFLLISYNTKDL